MAPRITRDSSVVVSVNQVSTELQEETIILGLNDGYYFGLSDVGARVWQLLQEPRVVLELRDTLAEEYDVDADRCFHDLVELLQDFAERGLVDVTN